MGKIKSKLLVSDTHLDVHIDNLSFQLKDDDINYSGANRTVITSIKLYGYDSEAPCLWVYPDKFLLGHFIVVDGIKRLIGSRENGKIKTLPCLILDCKTLNEAQQLAKEINTPIQEIRNRKTLGYYIIDTLAKSYKERERRRDLAISNEELQHIAELSGKSITVCNRGLCIVRKISKEVIETNPSLEKQDLRTFFLDIIKSKKYPELNDFYNKNVFVSSLESSYKKREKSLHIDNIGDTRNEETAIARDDTEPQIINLNDDLKKPVDSQLSVCPTSALPNETNQGNVNEILTFFEELNNVSRLGDGGIVMLLAKNILTKFLSNNPEYKSLIYIIHRCVSDYLSDFELLLTADPIQESKAANFTVLHQVPLALKQHVNDDKTQPLLFDSIA